MCGLLQRSAIVWACKHVQGDENPAPLPPQQCVLGRSLWQLVLAQSPLWATMMVYSGSGFDNVLEALGVNLTIFVPSNMQIVLQLQNAHPEGVCSRNGFVVCC